MAQAQHERSLVKEYAGRPFAIVGVNADPSPPAEVLGLNRQRSIPWRSFANDSRALEGGITRRWNVRTMPTTYLLDPEGVILRKWVGRLARREELEETIERAVKAAEK